MTKKLIALLIAASMAASMTACGGDNGDDTTAGDTTIADTTAADTTVADTDDTIGAPQISEELAKLHNAIKDAYGEEYLANMPIDAESLTNLYGINAEWVDEFVAEMPMMSANVDTLIIVKPTEGNSENVLSALAAYHTNRVENGMDYPMNLEKVKAADVFAKDGYVFYVMLGIIPEDLLYPEITDDMTEDDIIKLEQSMATAQYDAAVANNNKAIVAINSVLGE